MFEDQFSIILRKIWENRWDSFKRSSVIHNIFLLSLPSWILTKATNPWTLIHFKSLFNDSWDSRLCYRFYFFSKSTCYTISLWSSRMNSGGRYKDKLWIWFLFFMLAWLYRVLNIMKSMVNRWDSTSILSKWQF